MGKIKISHVVDNIFTFDETKKCLVILKKTWKDSKNLCDHLDAIKMVLDGELTYDSFYELLRATDVRRDTQ